MRHPAVFLFVLLLAMSPARAQNSGKEALSTTPDISHEGWRKVAADLERTRARHPEHLGMLRDLIVAYTRLLPFERDTARGMNLCSLIPRRIAEFEAQAGTLSAEDSRTLRRARALLYFQIGLYPLARAEIDQAPDDADLAILGKAMQAIGQAEFTERETFEVPGKRATCRVTVYATKGIPADPKLSYCQWFFVVRMNQAAPSTLWCALERQTLVETPRYYLYGCAGNFQKLLKLYGRQPPAYEDVKATVRAVIGNALKNG